MLKALILDSKKFTYRLSFLDSALLVFVAAAQQLELVGYLFEKKSFNYLFHNKK